MTITRPDARTEAAPDPGEHRHSVSASWLREQLTSPELRIVDASWYLPAAGRDARAEFAAGHVPGAVHLDLASDLADPDAAIRNTLASPEHLARALGRAGISNRHRVVIYDHLGGFSAGRIWWTLRYLGHTRVAVLDGGLAAWEALGEPLERNVEPPHPERFEPKTEPRRLADRAEVLRAIQDPETRILDVRAERRFLGLDPETTPRRGHVPGALNVPYDRNLVGDPPHFRPLPELDALYRDAGLRSAQRIVTMCGSGVTASLTAFVLDWLGYPDVAVYDGSWAEWGQDATLPIESAADSASPV